MSYVSESLHPNEVVEFETQLSGIIYVFPWLLIATILTGPFGIIGGALGILFLILQMIRKATSEFAVTSSRVIIKTGWLFRTTIELNISKVESVDIHQGIFGRMFDYGTVIVVGTGASKQPFQTVANPIQFRKAVQAVQLRQQATQAHHTVNNTTQIAVFVSARDFEESGAARPWDVSSLPDFQRLAAQASPVIEPAPVAGLIAQGGGHSAEQNTHGEATWGSAFDDVPPWEPRSPAEWWRELSGFSKIVTLAVLGVLILLITTSGVDTTTAPEPKVQYEDADGNRVPVPNAASATVASPTTKKIAAAFEAALADDWLGRYDGTFDGATGGIDIARSADGKLSISIGMGGKSCAGGIDAVVDQPNGDTITVTKAPYEDHDDQESACRLSLRKTGDEIVLHEEEVCMNHHGMSCGFDGSARRTGVRAP